MRLKLPVHRKLFVAFSALVLLALSLVTAAAAGILGRVGAEKVLWWLVVIAAVAFGLSAALVAWLVAVFCEPIWELRRKMRALTPETYDTQVSVHGMDEMADIAAAVNRIKATLLHEVDERRQLIERLISMSRQASSIDASQGVEDLLESALDMMLREIGGECGAVYWHEPERRELLLRTQRHLSRELPEEVKRAPSFHGFMGRALALAQLVVVDETAARQWLEQVAPGKEWRASLACVPLKSGERVLGLMNLAGGRGHELSPAEVGMLTTLGAQIGAALGAAQSYEDASRRIRHISELGDISYEVTKGQSEKGVMELLVAKACAILDVDMCAVFPQGGRELLLRGTYHTGLRSTGAPLPVLRPGEGVVGRAVRERRPVLVHDVSLDRRLDEWMPFYHDHQIVSVLAVPLGAGDAAFGGVEVYSGSRAEFNEEDAKLLTIVANQAGAAIANARLHQEAKAQVAVLEALFETVENLGASSEPEHIMSLVLSKLQEVTSCRTASISLLDETTGTLVMAEFRGPGESSSGQARCRNDLPLGNCWAVKKGKLIVVRDAQSDCPCREDRQAKELPCFVCAPLTAGGKTLGVMQMSSDRPDGFSEANVRIFATLADQVAIAVERAQLFRRVEQLAITDTMTGLFNYRRFRDKLTEELHQAERYEHPLSLLMMDIDHFKAHNDRFGHPSGDGVLRQVADVVRTCLRTVDFFARYGGEEFALLLPNTDREGALAVAEKVRSAVEQEFFYGDTTEPQVHKTISVGIASYPEDAQTEEDLVERADAALYLAKERGRNRVESPDEAHTPGPHTPAAA